ncbi:MAG: hypothetical protein IKL88_04815, partial [Erysipelotrichales bacterium]|nr:hypothetical protein [Erysipelotrichales bacterium]
MNKLFKGLLSVVVALAMVIGVMPSVEVHAEESKSFCIVDGGCYSTLQDAVDNAGNNATITFSKDEEQADGVTITDKNLTIDLKGHTFTVTEGASTNNRNIIINGSSVVTVENGTLVAKGNYSSGAYGTIRTEGTANVKLTNLKLYNYRGNGLNIKACTGTTVTIDNTEIYSQYGGGIESAGGTI